MAAIGQPTFANCSANKPKTALLRANKAQYEGVVGAAWLTMGPYVLPLSPNDHPTAAQGPPGVVGGRPRITIFQPTNASLKMAKSSPEGGGVGKFWR